MISPSASEGPPATKQTKIDKQFLFTIPALVELIITKKEIVLQRGSTTRYGSAPFTLLIASRARRRTLMITKSCILAQKMVR
jgi:hypothetical protein